MNQASTPYSPISCEFHDLLEALATVRRPAVIRYRDQDGAARQVTATITDIFSRERVEFVSLGTGEALRLDQLVEVNGEKLRDY
ncbi:MULTISPECIES: hypothetical protein [Cupriavidus]|uniref:Transcriptional antiterminator, Rof n=1 Tax=Cupriavidus oxalaticus TaxID=96344 RepID=A0A4P7L6U5_9BURK|nr:MULTISPECIES: hypothetical protein [Cupriavidus]MBF6991486.1 hypothetical protein [Cupriavidus sp. IK-TO18]QBY51338.1 hypothetical protein E0W60_09490 [Cupriavidus oxalaticus]TDF64720.1 hypothetical protein E1J61_17300 [Cupriavidus sp. L7L]